MSAANTSGPPVVELVIGVQFSPLTKLTAGHFGLFWNDIGREKWGRPADHPPLDDRFESFEPGWWSQPVSWQLKLEPAHGPGRFLLFNQDDERLVQVQPTRLHLNWQKRDGFYPSYTKLIGEFEAMFRRFAAFVESNQLGPLLINQWELTYIDAFPQEEYWGSLQDWRKVLPGLFGDLFDAGDLGLKLERRAAEWSFEIVPQRGRVYLAAAPGRWGPDKRECLMLTTTARGPLAGNDSKALRDGLDLGHEKALGAFRKLVAADVRKRWEQS
jgi:uncharacterized protein (TIGR04255 family)